MTALLTSVGPATPVSEWTEECNALAHLTPMDFEFLAGEIAGVPIPLTLNLSPSQNAKLEEIDARWIGLKRRHLVEITAQSKKGIERWPGVVLIACGIHPTKARPIVHASLQKLCSVIVVDLALAEKIEQELEALPRRDEAAVK